MSQQPMKRYTRGQYGFEESPDGEYVKHADVEAVEARCKQLEYSMTAQVAKEMDIERAYFQHALAAKEQLVALNAAEADKNAKDVIRLNTLLAAREARVLELEEESRQWEKESLCKLIVERDTLHAELARCRELLEKHGIKDVH